MDMLKVYAMALESMAGAEDEKTKNRALKNLKSTLTRINHALSRPHYVDHETSVPMWFIDPDGVFLDVNCAFETTFLIGHGLTAADIIGKSMVDFWPRDVARQYQYNNDLAMALGTLVTTEEQAKACGARVSWSVIKTRWEAPDGTVGVLGMALPRGCIFFNKN